MPKKGGGGGGGKTTIGVPTWARPLFDYVFGGNAGAPNIDPNSPAGNLVGGINAFGPFGQQWGQMPYPQIQGNANQAGPMGMGLTADQISQALGMSNIAMGQGGNLMGMTPAFMDAANTYAGGGWRGGVGNLGDLYNQVGAMRGNFSSGGGVGEATQAFGDAASYLAKVGAPGAYNAYFQNQMQNQITPEIMSSFASRGLGSSGASAAALSEAGQNLANELQREQFNLIPQYLGAETSAANAITNAYGTRGALQNQAAGIQGDIARNIGTLGLDYAQLPGQIQGQLLQNLGLGGGLGNLGLSNLGTGRDVYAAYAGLPADVFDRYYGSSMLPFEGLVGLMGGTIGGTQHRKSMFPWS